MLKLLIFIIFLAAVLGLMWFAHLGIVRSRYDMGERYLHCRYLAAYLLLLAVMANRYTFSYVLLAVDKLINLPMIAKFWSIVLPMRRFELVYLAVSLLISNFIFLLVTSSLFLLVKKIFKNNFINVQDMELFQKILHLPWLITAMLYQEDEETDSVQVTDKGVIMSIWAGRMKFAFVVIGIAELIFLVVGIFSSGKFFVEHAVTLVEGWYMLPAAGYLLFEQIQYYLEKEIGYDGGSFGTEEISEHLEGNLKALMHIYCEEFKSTDALMEYYSWEDMKPVRDGLRHNDLNRNQIGECVRPEVLCVINNQLKAAGVKQNASFQNALIALLNGESVNIRDYIQGEFMIYLSAFMNFFVSQEKTFLVLCENRKKARMIRNEITESLYQLNKIYSIWKVADIDGADSNEDMNILVCSYQDFVNHRLIDKRQDFFRTLYGVVMTDGVEFCAQGNVQKELIFAEFGRIRQKLQYILLSETDNDSLRTAFEYYTNSELIPYKNDQLLNNVYVMIWEEESGNKIQRALGVGNEQAPYFGVSIPLALVGAKYDLPCIHMIASDKKGFRTYRDAMKLSYQEILSYLKCSIDLEKMICYNKFHVNDRSDLEMLILYDSEYNFYNMLWAWMKYGGKDGTMMHIVSPPYMLREFFAANLRTQLLRNTEFDALISYRSGLKHTRFLKMLLELCNAGIDEEELMKKNQEYKWNYENVRELLSECLKDVLNSQEFYNIYECFRFEEYCSFDLSEDRYRRRTLVKLTDENIRRRIQGQLVFASLVTKNNLAEELPILKGNLYNHYLRGQIVPINGYMQRIINVNDGTVFTEQTVTTEKLEYFQTAEFEFSNMKNGDECVDFDILDFNLYTAYVARSVYGYWSSTKAVSFQEEGRMRLHDICSRDGSPIVIAKKNIQILEIKMKRSCFTDGGEKAVLLAGFMFKELFKTLFPENHQNLFAVTVCEPESGYWQKLLSDASNASLEDKLRSIIPFVRKSEYLQTDEEFVSLYIVEFSSLEMGMITKLYANRMRLFQMTASYLSWYRQETSKASYLNLGGETPAPCFDPEGLLAFCEKVIPSYERYEAEPKKEVSVKQKYVCSFCGKPTLFTYRLKDDRRMCRSCKQQQLDQRDEIKELYFSTVDFLCRGYHIGLRKNIHLRLRSADAIRRHCHISGTGRVVGFYQNKTHELWIESRGPKNAVQSTMIHELTHAWQYDNLDVKALYRKHPKEALEILEGHAGYMEVDVMRKLGEEEYADYMEQQLLQRDDEYGKGFRRLKDYLEEKKDEGSEWTPYRAMEELISNL